MWWYTHNPKPHKHITQFYQVLGWSGRMFLFICCKWVDINVCIPIISYWIDYNPLKTHWLDECQKKSHQHQHHQIQRCNRDEGWIDNHKFNQCIDNETKNPLLGCLCLFILSKSLCVTSIWSGWYSVCG